VTEIPKYPSLPEVIKALQRKGLTQNQIEAKTGISQSFLSNLKAGRRVSMKLEAGLRLLALYGERVHGWELVWRKRS